MWHDAITNRPSEGIKVIGILKLTKEKVFCEYDELDDMYFIFDTGVFRMVDISYWHYDETGLPEKE